MSTLPSHRAVILTALPIEYTAVSMHLQDLKEETYKGTIYEKGLFHSDHQSWLVGIAQVGKGNVGTAAGAERAIAYFRPSVVIYVGIAGGLKDVQVGDVVVANKVYSYESGKADVRFEPRPTIALPTYPIGQRAMAEMRKDRWRQRIKCVSGKKPLVYEGAIAAGEKVIASWQSEIQQFLMMHYGDALAVEMEGYGFLQALHTNSYVQALVVRGIANIVGEISHVREQIDPQMIAAQHASAFAFEVLAQFQNSLDIVEGHPLASLYNVQKKEDQAEKKRILAVFANPLNTGRLQLDVEERTIRQVINASKSRDVVVNPIPAATICDLSSALLYDKYQIIHISVHGNGRGLVLANEHGGYSLINQEMLANLLSEYSSSIQCVILNACYSFVQGALISQHIPYTIAMEYPITDQAAIKFTEGFYSAYAAGKSIEEAYREGSRNIQFETLQKRPVPRLIKQGEISQDAIAQLMADNIISVDTDLHRSFDGSALIGVALDLSASMHRSLNNQTSNAEQYLGKIRQSFAEITQYMRRSTQDNLFDDNHSSIDMFVYGFGLRDLHVCDLLLLWHASQKLINEKLIETISQEFMQEEKNRYKGFKLAENLFRNKGLGSIVDRLYAAKKYQSKIVIRQRAWHQVKDQLKQEIEKSEDVTLSMDDIVQWWSESGDMLSNAVDILFGKATPIAEVLTKVIARFEREFAKREQKPESILILISDGKFGPTNPLPLAEKLREMGVTIFSCLITNRDVVNSRQLVNEAGSDWDLDTKIMFEMASPLPANTDIETFLLNEGWTIYPHAKLFVQANHSKVLEDFLRVVPRQLENSEVGVVSSSLQK